MTEKSQEKLIRLNDIRKRSVLPVLAFKKDFEEALSNWEDLFSIGTPKGCVVEYPPEPKEEDYILTKAPQSWCYVEEKEEV